MEYPEKVKLLSNKRIVKITCGGFHTLVLTSENEVYSFGSGIYGECGTGEFTDSCKPRLVKFPNNSPQQPLHHNVTSSFGEKNALDMHIKELVIIRDIVAGGRHSLALSENG